MKKEAIVCMLVLILLSSAALASATSIDFDPDTFYEAQTRQFNVSVNNFGYGKMINEINLAMSNFRVTEVTDFLGWSNTFTNTTIRWFGGSVENNVIFALFQFKAAAPLVADNQSSNADIDVRYTDGTNQSFQMPIMLLNDYTGPVISNNVPSDNGFLRANAASQQISAEVADPETGVKEVKFRWKDCTNGTYTQITLACNSTLCTGTGDFSSYDEGDQACFEFEAKNNAEEVTLINGTTSFDGTPPNVELVSPADNAYVGLFGTFIFNATDNLAPALDCDFVLDNNVYDSVQVQNSALSNITVNFTSASEGNHTWKVACTDTVGLTTNSGERDFMLDKTAPAITLHSPANGSIIPDTAKINITASDNYALASVQTSRDINNLTGWASGRNEVVVTATDSAGNVVTETFVFFIDRNPPTISNLAPGDGATLDVHVDFAFDINDDYDSQIDCTLVLDGQDDLSGAFASGTRAVLAKSMALGSFNWSVRCTDDAGNSMTTLQRGLTTTDQSGPDITLQDVQTVARGDSFTINATVTDVSGVDYVYATLGAVSAALNKDGDQYTEDVGTSSNSSLGNYTYTVHANDTLGYTESETDTFLLVKGYVFTLALSPSTADPGETVSLSGNVIADDNTNIPENTVRLVLPDGTASVAVGANGDFSHTFTAPGSPGVYDITAEIAGNNGHTYTHTVQLTVQGVSSSSGGSSGGQSGTGRGFKQHTEQKPAEVYTENADNENIQEEDQADDEEAQDSSDQENIIVEEEPIVKDVAAGVGKGTGLFSAPAFKWLGALILAMVVISLAVIAFSRIKGGKGPRKDEWDQYIERRREE